NFIDKSLDNKGMALVTVIGILGVIAVLATGMFYFSSNELNFSKMDSGRVQAEYLARAGVEIASKSFPGVSDKFTNVTKTSPVEMTLYLTVTTDSKGKTQTELVRNKVEGADTVNVKIYPEERTVKVVDVGNSANNKTEKRTVYVYSATAHSGKAKASAQGYSFPPAIISEQPETPVGLGNVHLGWTRNNGAIDRSVEAKYSHTTQSAGSDFWGSLLNWLFGVNSKIDVYAASYNGVISITEDDIQQGKIKINNVSSDRALFVWAAPAVLIDTQIDLSGQSNISGLAISADSIVFSKPVTVYRSSIVGTRAGDIAISPSGSEKATVWFKNDVYYNYGTRKRTLITKGKYELLQGFDFIKYYEMSQSERSKVLVKVSDDVSDSPTVNSLTKIVWE
ncbi:MAG: hypothetical protein RR198_08205, partial [Oscillospiraceae bacterium]